MGFFRPFSLPTALALALALTGCDDRRAGTEVGNPEVRVTAQVMLFDEPGSVEVANLGFNVMSLGYGMAGYVGTDSGTCWKRPAGTLRGAVAPGCPSSRNVASFAHKNGQSNEVEAP